MINNENEKKEIESHTPENNITRIAWQYFLENPIKTFSAITLFWGCLLTLLFFLRIGHMPDIDMESAASLLYAIALLGSFFAAYTMLIMVTPGLFLAAAIHKTKEVSLLHLLCITTGASLPWFLMLLNSFKKISNSFTLYSIFLITLLSPLVGLLFSIILKKTDIQIENDDHKKNRLSPKENPVKIYLWSLGVLIVIGVTLSVPLFFIILIGMNGNFRTTSNGDAIFIATLLVVLIATSAAMIGGVKPSNTTKAAIVFAPLLLFIVLASTGSFSFFSVLAVKALGQGEIGAARITVTGKTCHEINETLGQRVCITSDGEEATPICPVMIKSRIGSQVVLDFAPIGIEKHSIGKAFWITTNGTVDGKPGESTTRRIIIDKAKLLSWQPLKGFDERDQKQISFSTTPRVATWLIQNASTPIPKSVHSMTLVPKIVIEQCGDQPMATKLTQ